MHGVDEAKPLLHAALADERGDGIGEVDKPAPAGRFKPELFGERFHAVRGSSPKSPARQKYFVAIRRPATTNHEPNQTNETLRRGVANRLTAAGVPRYFLKVRR
jgi:hypothetical protein